MTPPVRIFGVAVTYRRPEVLDRTLRIYSEQTRPLDALVIVDNAAEPQVAVVAARWGGRYIAMSTNAGPAGAFAEGIELVLDRANDEDWVLLIDDDDPPTSATTVERLVAFGHQQLSVDPRTAGVGNGGSVYNRRTGTFRRFAGQDLQGPLPVDTLFGNAQPLYRCAALRRHPGFDRDFFWGFEEAQMGLSLRNAGHALYVDGSAFLRLRKDQDRSGLALRTGRTPSEKAAWRRYYSVRNSTVLARQHAQPWAVPFVAAGGAAKGTAALVRRRRPLKEVVLPARGAIEGLLGRMGRRVDPGTNEKE